MRFLQRFLAALVALALFAAAFVFASIILAVIAVIGVLAGAWIWWRTRNLPRRGGDVIEGEYRVEVETGRLEARPPER